MSFCWLVVLGFNATLTAKVIIIMAAGDAHVFPGFLTQVLTQLIFQKPPATFLRCFCRDERRTYAEKKVHFNRGSNSKPADHEFDRLTAEPPGQGVILLNAKINVSVWLNPFPNHKTLEWSKWKEFADDNFESDENGGKYSERVENTVGKGEITLWDQFLLFPQSFQKTYTADT